MTERSFRAPSPNRGSPSLDHHNAPPVPAVPKTLPDSIHSVHRRASSLEPPYRGGSPVGRGGGRGVSLDRGAPPTAGRGQAQAHAARITSLSQVPEDETDGGLRSVNFSRPISPPLQAPKPASSTRVPQGGWHSGPYVNPDATFRGATKPRPQTSDGPSAFATHSTQQRIQNAADRPVATKTISQGVQGARLSSGSMRAKPSGSVIIPNQHASQSVDPNSSFAVYDPSTRTFIHKQDAMQRFRELNDQQDAPPEYVYHEEPREQPRHAPQHEPQPYVPKPAAVPVHNERAQSPSPVQEHSNTPAVHYEYKPSRPEQLEDSGFVEPVEPPQVRPGGLELARQTSEEVAGTDIRPPVDANTSPKLESTGPDHKEESQNPQSPKLASNLDSPYPRLSTPVNTPSSRLAQESERSSTTRSERTHSLSPPRNAHFAPVTIELPNGIKHQPPPRSVSPAKSALKASPSVSRRNSSPYTDGVRIPPKGAPSEASDTMSEDGTRKKKKTVRVSFDEEAVVAGTSAYVEPDTPSSPTGLSQSRWSTINEDRAMEDVMTPRPVLPSFGSIRGKNRRADEPEVPEKVTETVSSSMSTSVGSIGDPLQSSNDHVVGGILAQDFASKQRHQDPLPPEVTSVEGSGYVSDSSSNDSALEELINQHINRTKSAGHRQQIAPDLEPKTLTTPSEIRSRTIEVPIIAVQPASPSPRAEMPEPKFEPIPAAAQDQSPRPKAEKTIIPGGWDDEESDQEAQDVSTKPIGIYSAAPINAANLKSLAPQPADDDSSDDNSSIYSDAYEELTDGEDGGFASIDAVVESPVAGPSSGLMFSKYADKSPVEPTKSPLRNTQTTGEYAAQAPAPKQDWDATQQHWSGLNESRKQQHTESSSSKPPVDQTNTSKTVKTKQPSSTAMPKSKHEAAPKLEETRPPKMIGPAQPRKSALKKTTPTYDEPPQTEVHIRKSMRGNNAPVKAPTGTHMRQSMRGADVTSSRATPGLAASRHSMPPPPSTTAPTRGALQKKHIPASAVPATKARPQSAIVKPTVAAPTYDSDSDASVSSFQRSRPRAKRGANTRYTMRASMRGNTAPSLRETPAPRPMSPVERPYSPTPTALRKSMRPSSPTPVPPASSTNKSSRFSIRSLSPAGRFKPTKTTSHDAPPLPSPTSSPKRMSGLGGFGKSKAKPVGKPQRKSRFADSSDEEEDARPSRFQSRFADSDSEEDYELPPGLAPVRGIPRRPGDEDHDSTDLEEELSDAEPSSKKTKAIEKGGSSLTNGHTNGKTASFAPGTLSQSKHAPELPSFESGKKS